MKKILAIANLGLHFIWHFLKKPFVRKNGLDTFFKNYSQDRILPLSKADKNSLIKYSECINCKLCDVACPSLFKLPRERFPGPSYIVNTYARSVPDFWAIQLDLSLCSECNECEKICPNEIPVTEAILFIQEKIAEEIRLVG